MAMQDLRKPIWDFLDAEGIKLTAPQHEGLKKLINAYADNRDGAYKKIYEELVAAHTVEGIARKQARARAKKERWRARRALKYNAI
jgi:hypothetical protein